MMHLLFAGHYLLVPTAGPDSACQQYNPNLENSARNQQSFEGEKESQLLF